MRISSRMMSRQVMTNLNSLYNNLSRSHTQVSTGKQFQKASEAPIKAVRSMNLTISEGRNEQYLTNIDKARTIYRETEDSLMAISDSVVGIKNNLLGGLTGTLNQEDRKVLAKEIEQLKENIVAQFNKEYSGQYYFGGYNTFDPPFVQNEAGQMLYNGLSIENPNVEEAGEPDAEEHEWIDNEKLEVLCQENILIRTGKSTEVGVSLPGIAIVKNNDDNLFTVIDDIIDNLNAGLEDSEKLGQLTSKIEDFFVHIQNHVSTVGAKADNLDVMKAQVEGIKMNLSDALSKETDVEIEEAIINYKTNQMVYNSALAVAAQIIQPTLLDFLR